MSDSGVSATDAFERTNNVYWKSLLALFCAAFAIIALILVYMLTDALLGGCAPNQQGCTKVPSIFLITVMAGATGAIFSNITRLYQVDEVSELFANKISDAKIHRMALYAAVPAVIGAVAAAVVYLVFAGKFIQGTPFPLFTCDAGQKCGSLSAFVDHWGPENAEDYAKMIFWGFVAGFSERLVPDMLGQYSKLIEQKATEAEKNQKALDATKTTAESARKKAVQERAKADEAKKKAELPTATPDDKDAATKADAQATAEELKAKKAEDDYKKQGGS
jgi:hypothetical protein